MATHTSILAWKIPWTGEPGGQESDMTWWLNNNKRRLIVKRHLLIDYIHAPFHLSYRWIENWPFKEWHLKHGGGLMERLIFQGRIALSELPGKLLNAHLIKKTHTKNKNQWELCAVWTLSWSQTWHRRGVGSGEVWGWESSICFTHYWIKSCWV